MTFTATAAAAPAAAADGACASGVPLATAGVVATDTVAVVVTVVVTPAAGAAALGDAGVPLAAAGVAATGAVAVVVTVVVTRRDADTGRRCARCFRCRLGCDLAWRQRVRSRLWTLSS